MHNNDRPTIAALAIVAMCAVALAHEAIGHGSMCVALGGHVTLLTTSLFRCDAHSAWIDVAGPAMNFALGLVAYLIRRATPPGFAQTRLLLLLWTAFAWFWEGGYLMRAMIIRDGDLYFFAEFLFGVPSLWMCAVGFLAGLVLYLLTGRITSRGLNQMFDTVEARRVARAAWVAATVAAVLAALLYRGQPYAQNIRDTVLEFGLAAIPLLILPRESDLPPQTRALIGRRWSVIGMAVIVFAVFAATMGRGLGHGG